MQARAVPVQLLRCPFRGHGLGARRRSNRRVPALGDKSANNGCTGDRGG